LTDDGDNKHLGIMMHLIGFHRVLIVCAAAFCFGYGLWELAGYRAGSGAAGSLVIGMIALLAAGALVFYLWRLRRFLRLPD
jgi:hypothetical protein